MIEDVLKALWTMNHHVKDLKYVQDWLWICGRPEERYEKYKRERRDFSSCQIYNDLDEVAKEHYNVDLMASRNVLYNPSEVEERDEDGLVDLDFYYVEDTAASFVYPATSNFDALKENVSTDYKYIYRLKRVFLEYIMENQAEEKVSAQVISRIVGKDNQKLVCIQVCTTKHTYKFHHGSEVLYNLNPEVPEEEKIGKSKIKIFKFSKNEICNAKKTVEEFLQSRNVSLSEEGSD